MHGYTELRRSSLKNWNAIDSGQCLELWSSYDQWEQQATVFESCQTYSDGSNEICVYFASDLCNTHNTKAYSMYFLLLKGRGDEVWHQQGQYVCLLGCE